MLLTDGVQSIGAHPVPASSCAPCCTSWPPPALPCVVCSAANHPSRTLALLPFRHFSPHARVSVTLRSWYGEKEALGPERALVCWPQDCGAKLPSAPRHRNAAPGKLLHPRGVCCLFFSLLLSVLCVLACVLCLLACACPGPTPPVQYPSPARAFRPLHPEPETRNSVPAVHCLPRAGWKQTSRSDG